jgi:hypothetical protein
MVDYRKVVVRELAKLNFKPEGGGQMRKSFDKAYPQLKDKFGKWHRFDAMLIPHFVGQVGAEFHGF